MASQCIAAPGDNDKNDLTIQEANDIVTRYQSVHFGGTPAFADVSIDPNNGSFNYTIGDTSYSVPVDQVRHSAQ